MHAVVLLEEALIQPKFQEERNRILAIEGIAKHIHGLLELGRPDVGGYEFYISLLLREMLHHLCFFSFVGFV